jgi:hypothetical protein
VLEMMLEGMKVGGLVAEMVRRLGSEEVSDFHLTNFDIA